MRNLISFWLLLFALTILVFPTVAFAEDVTILIDEQQHAFAPSPFIMEGKMFIPADKFCEVIGAKLEHFNDGKAFLAYGEEVELSVSDKYDLPQVNGEEVALEDPVQIIEGTAFVPLRLAAERLGYNVSWDGEHRVVTINTCNEREPGYLAIDKEAAEKEDNPEVTGSFIWPVQGGEISSNYGMRNGRFHSGLDIRASTGTPILASDSGVVIFSGWYSAYGRLIVIEHGEYYTSYAHNSSNMVSVGDTVNQGEGIGKIGMSGNATGPHLHFEIRKGGIWGQTYNPLNYVSK